jgi:LmbE family N-acetylglucosaminyl deacetylase
MIPAVPRLTVMHVAPHPDDELLGAPATLMALRDAGWAVLNVACGLGRPVDAERRRAELTEACRRARFDLDIIADAPPIGARDDHVRAERELTDVLAVRLAERLPDWIIGPSVADGHHGHETVARATRCAIEHVGRPARWAMWGLWGDLPLANVLVPFGEERVAEIASALAAHAGELARSDYAALTEARARMNAILGAERVLGFGSGRLEAPCAELLTDVRFDGAQWAWLAPRNLDPEDPLAGTPAAPIAWWLDRASPQAVMRSMRWS